MNPWPKKKLRFVPLFNQRTISDAWAAGLDKKAALVALVHNLKAAGETPINVAMQNGFAMMRLSNKRIAPVVFQHGSNNYIIARLDASNNASIRHFTADSPVLRIDPAAVTWIGVCAKKDL